MEEQHIYHHQDSEGPHVSVKVEKNSKGYNYEASISGAVTVEQALNMLHDTVAQLRAEYGEGQA